MSEHVVYESRGGMFHGPMRARASMFFFFNDPPPTEFSPLPLTAPLPLCAEIRRYRYNTLEPGPKSGDFIFMDRETSLPGFTSGTGHAFASLVLGAVNSGSRSIYRTEQIGRAHV